MFRHSIVDMGALGEVTGIRDKINRGKDLNKRDKVGYLTCTRKICLLIKDLLKDKLNLFSSHPITHSLI